MKESMVERKILWGDLDSLGIVFYPRYYEWMDGCCHLFLEALNLNMVDLWQERKILFNLVETSSRYFKPVRYFEKIHICTNIDRLEKKTFTLKHTIRSASDNTVLVEGFEKRICVDTSNPENLRAQDFPEDLYVVFQDALEEKEAELSPKK